MSPGFSAFLSYPSTHRSDARDLHVYLEHFRVPKDLVGTAGLHGQVPGSLGKIFFDRADAAGATDLREELRRALRDSATLIVLCTTHTGQPDTWVDKEVADYRAHMPEGRVYPVVLDGEPPNCFPPAMYSNADGTTRTSPEPLAADFRKTCDGLFDGRLKLVAALLGVPFDALRRRHEAMLRRRRRLIGLVIAAYIATVTVGGIFVTRAAIDLSRSRSRAVADRAANVADAGHFDTAALMALVALPPRSGAVMAPVPEAEAQLTRALANNYLRRVIPAHSATIWALASHPDRPWVLTGASDGATQITDWETGRVVRRLRSHGSAVLAVAFDSRGIVAASADASGHAVLTSVMNGDAIAHFRKEGHAFRSIAFSPDGSRIVLGCADGLAYIIDAHSGRQLSKSPQHGGFVVASAFSGDGKRVLSGSYNGRILLWSVDTGDLVREFKSRGTVFHLGRLRDAWFATFTLNDTVRLWYDTHDEPVDVRIDTPAGRITTARDGRYIVSSHWDGTARVFDGTTWTLINVLRHKDWVDGAVFSKDGQSVITADHAGQVNVWNNPGTAWEPSFLQHGAETGSGSMALSPDGSTVLSGSYQGEVLAVTHRGPPLRLRRDIRCAEVAPGDGSCGIRDLSVSPDGGRVLVVTAANRAELRELGTDRSLWNSGAVDRVEAAAFLSRPDGIVTAGGGVLSARSFASETLLKSDIPGSGRATRISAEPGGQRVVVITEAAGHPFVGVPGLKLIAKTSWRHTRAILSVAWSPDGQSIATGGADGVVRWGKPDAEMPERSVPAHTWVNALMFSSDSRLIVTGGEDGIVAIWDTRTGMSLFRRKLAMRGTIDSVAVAPRSRAIYYRTSLGWVGRLQLNIPSANSTEIGCGLLPDGRSEFSDSELLQYTFLDPSERRPCDRFGPLSMRYYERWQGLRPFTSWF